MISDDIRMFVLNSFSPGSQTPVDISSDDIENKASPCDHFEMAMSEHERLVVHIELFRDETLQECLHVQSLSHFLSLTDSLSSRLKHDRPNLSQQ